jgi:hypothetical protein
MATLGSSTPAPTGLWIPSPAVVSLTGSSTTAYLCFGSVSPFFSNHTGHSHGGPPLSGADRTTATSAYTSSTEVLRGTVFTSGLQLRQKELTPFFKAWTAVLLSPSAHTTISLLGGGGDALSRE